MSLRKAAPRSATVQEMANLLLTKRGSTTIQTVGEEEWAYNFTQCHPELKSCFSQNIWLQANKTGGPKDYSGEVVTPFSR